MNAPPGPFRPAFWRSPLRGPWLTSTLGSMLLVLVSIVIVTGFLSHVAYQPDLRGNAIVPAGADLPLNFAWPTWPTHLYAVSQGLHVNVGLAAVPLLLAKLWSVIPRLWVWPAVTSPGHALERASIALLVSSAVFQFATGIMNAQYWYAFGFGFVVAHYYGAIIFTASLALHVVLKAPVIVRAYRERGWLRQLRSAEPEPPGGLAPALTRAPDDQPPRPVRFRRRRVGTAGRGECRRDDRRAGEVARLPRAATGGLPGQPHGGARAGHALDGRPSVPARRSPAAAPRFCSTAMSCWRCPSTPHACRSPASRAGRRHRSGPAVRLAELVRAAGLDPVDVSDAFVRSLQPRGALSETSLNGDQVRDPDSMLALKVNGADLPLDHGFPARIIVPALPGVHNTKWVASIDFGVVV